MFPALPSARNSCLKSCAVPLLPRRCILLQLCHPLPGCCCIPRQFFPPTLQNTSWVCFPPEYFSLRILAWVFGFFFFFPGVFTGFPSTKTCFLSLPEPCFFFFSPRIFRIPSSLSGVYNRVLPEFCGIPPPILCFPPGILTGFPPLELCGFSALECLCL